MNVSLRRLTETAGAFAQGISEIFGALSFLGDFIGCVTKATLVVSDLSASFFLMLCLLGEIRDFAVKVMVWCILEAVDRRLSNHTLIPPIVKSVLNLYSTVSTYSQSYEAAAGGHPFWHVNVISGTA